MPPRNDRRTKLDRAWLVEERSEIRHLEAQARLGHARAAVARRHGPALGLDGAAEPGIPTELAAFELRRLGDAAARVGESRARELVAQAERRAARLILERRKR